MPPAPTHSAKTDRSWPKRIFWALVCLVILLVLCVIALRIFITTAPGSRFIEGQINKRTFGPVEAIKISGLSGDPLKAVSFEQIVIKDKDGDWLRLQDLNMTWKPLAFLKDHVWIQDLTIENADVLRKPVLNPTTSTEPLPKMTMENYALGSLNLDERLMGQALSLTSSGKFVAETSGAVTATLKAARLDAAGDALDLDFKRTDAGQMTGVFEIEGAASGAIASLMKAPGAVTGSGKVSGDDAQGGGTAVIAFGGQDTLTAKADWTASDLTAKANINLDNWPAFSAIRERLGSNLVSTFTLGRDEARAFSAALNVPGLSVDAAGNLPASGFVPARATVDIQADDVKRYVTLPEGYSAGRASAKGRVDISAPYGFDGRLSLESLTSPYGRAAQLSGPISASQTGEDQYRFKTDVTAADLVTTAELPIDLAAKTQIKTAGDFDMKTGRLTLDSFDVASGINQIAGTAALTIDGQSLDVTAKGTAAVKAIGAFPEGFFKADVALLKTPDSLMAVTTDGAFRPSAALAEPLGGLMGAQIVFKANMTPIENGLKISEAKVTGDNARAAIAGILKDTLDLTGEAVLSAPLDYKSVQIDGGAEASFTLTGPRAAPALRLDAKAGSVTAQNYVLKEARLRTEITDIFEAPKGPVQIEADTEHGPLSVSTQFASTPSVYIADDIELTWGRLKAAGDLKYPEDGIATGAIKLNMPERNGQYARAALTLSNAGGEQGVSLTAQAKEIAYAGLNLDTLMAEAEGTLFALTGTVKAKGQRGEALISRRFNIDAPFTVARNPEDGIKASMSPEASYGNISLTARTPIIATYADGDMSIDAPLNVADGTVDVSYQRSQTSEEFKLGASALPITLIPMPGNLADTRGRVSAEIEMSALRNAPLQGGGTIRLTDWRGFDVKKEQGVTGNLSTVINGGTAQTTLTASSPAGFKADGQLRTPLLAAETLTGTRLNMSAPIEGTFAASGAAASVFGLFTPSDAELGGSLSADISISGSTSSPRVEGQAGGQDIRFEMPELGTRVRKGRMNAQFTNDTLTVSDLFVADSDDGTMSGAGKFKLGELGRPLGKVDINAQNFRVLDRKDVEAKVKGQLAFESAPKDATLSGEITIKKAEVKQFVSGAVSVIEIEVDEINRPDKEDKIEVKTPKTPINLDLKIRAPRKIFIRSRGMDVEMAVDSNVKGTVSEPLFYGEAKVVRGGYKLAGKTLDFVDGTITFDGDLATARVNFKAVADTQNLDANVIITGTVEDPVIELSSTPERPQDEILSALLFGRSATELSTVEAVQLAGALAQFSGAGGGLDLLGGLRDAFGISQLSVNFNPDGSAQLIGGRYLAKNVYLEVFSGAGADQTGAIIDWEIRRNLALRSRIRADNDQALSLKWKRDF